MVVPTKATVKLANVNTGHAQVIGIILCHFTNCYIIYPAGPVYYCPSHPSNTISSDALKFYVIFKKVMSEPLEHCDFVDPQGRSCKSPYQTKKIINYIQTEIVKFKSHRDRNIVAPTVCEISKQNLSQIIHQRFCHISINRLKNISRKRTHGGVPRKSP